MAIEQVLTLLIAERDKIDRAIQALQGSVVRRGRPPKNLAVSAAVPAPATGKTRKKRTFSAAQRKQQGERMKAYWAAKRKVEAKAVSKPKAGPAKKAAKAAAA